MVTFIEIYGKETRWGRRPKGDDDLSLIGDLKPHVAAAAHNHSGGKVVSTLWRVGDGATQSEIDALVNAHTDHSECSSDKDAQLRGLEIRPGTPTDSEVDSLSNRLSNQVGMDLSIYDEPGTGKDWVTYLKDETKDIGAGNWLCENPEHASPVVVAMSNNCSKGHDQYSENATLNRHTFDVTNWI